MNSLITDYQNDFKQVISHLQSELANLRTGRANPSMLDGVTVEAYGVQTPLVQLASINVPDARTILVEPWDKSALKDVEKALSSSKLGINPVNEGEAIRLTIPQLTEEMRKDLVKTVNQKLEDARIAVRNVREKVRESITAAEKDKEITEDDRFRLQKDLDDVVERFNGQIKEIGDTKEKEIMTI